MSCVNMATHKWCIVQVVATQAGQAPGREEDAILEEYLRMGKAKEEMLWQVCYLQNSCFTVYTEPMASGIYTMMP